MSMLTNTNQLALNYSTTLYQLLGSSISTTGKLLLLQLRLFLIMPFKLFNFNANVKIPFKKVKLPETQICLQRKGRKL